MTSAPDFIATAAISLSSVVTYVALIEGLDLAAIIARVIRGIPSTLAKFFPGSPLDPPRAGITATTAPSTSIYKAAVIELMAANEWRGESAVHISSAARNLWKFTPPPLLSMAWSLGEVDAISVFTYIGPVQMPRVSNTVVSQVGASAILILRRGVVASKLGVAS